MSELATSGRLYQRGSSSAILLLYIQPLWLYLHQFIVYVFVKFGITSEGVSERWLNGDVGRSQDWTGYDHTDRCPATLIKAD